MQRQEDILFVDARQRDEGLHIFDALFSKQLLIGAVPVDDNGFGKQDTQLFAALRITVDDLDGDSHVKKLGGQVIRGLAAADDHGVLNGMGLEPDFFQKRFRIPSGSDEGDTVPLQNTEITGRNIDFAVPFYGTDQDIVGNILAHGLAEVHNRHAV